MLAVRPDCTLPQCPACVLEALVTSGNFPVSAAAVTKDGVLVLAGARPPGPVCIDKQAALRVGAGLAQHIRAL